LVVVERPSYQNCQRRRLKMGKRRMDGVDALKLAIEREKGAGQFYRRAANATVDLDGKRAFEWLAKEELRHLAKLRHQLKSVLENRRWVAWKRRSTPIERTEVPLLSEATGNVAIGAGERDALRQAIHSEQEAIVFYRDAENSTPDLHGKTMFKALAREEEGHLALLEGELEWITKSHQYFTLHRFTLRAD
jgi:rubrerythrin